MNSNKILTIDFESMTTAAIGNGLFPWPLPPIPEPESEGDSDE